MNTIAAQPAHLASLLALRNALDAARPRIARKDRHVRIIPTDAIRVRTHLGAGRLVSVTDDAWCEIQLDGERRRDEYPIEAVSLV